VPTSPLRQLKTEKHNKHIAARASTVDTMDLSLQVCSFSKLLSTHTADGAMIKVCAGQTVACLPTHHHPVDLAILQWEILGNMSKLSHLFPALTRNNHDTMQQGPKVDCAATQQTIVNCQSEMGSPVSIDGRTSRHVPEQCTSSHLPCK